jgi:hypothetical protein
MVDRGIATVRKYLDDHERGMVRLGNLIGQANREFAEGYKPQEDGILSKRIADVKSRLAIKREAGLERLHDKADKAGRQKENSAPEYLTMNELSQETGISVSTLRAPIFRGAMKSKKDEDGILVESPGVLEYFKATDNENALESLGKYMKKHPEFTIRISKRGAYPRR